MSTKRKADITKQFVLALDPADDVYRMRPRRLDGVGFCFICAGSVMKALRCHWSQDAPRKIRFVVSNRSIPGGLKFAYCYNDEGRVYRHIPRRIQRAPKIYLGSHRCLYRALEAAIADVIGRENYDRLDKLTFFWIHIKAKK